MLTLRVHRDGSVRELSVPVDIVQSERLSAVFAEGFRAYQAGDALAPAIECDAHETAFAMAYLAGFQVAASAAN